MPFLILPTFAFVCRPQRAQSTNDRHTESLDSKCLSISSALTRAARTADCGFGHLLRWRMPSVKHQFNYGRSATGENEAVSRTRHAFTPSTLREKSFIGRPSKSHNHAMHPTHVYEIRPRKDSSRRRSNFRCSAIRSPLVLRSSPCNRLRKVLQPLT
jgi:hypothetical protein